MIRLAEKKDLNTIQDIFNKAKIFMRNDGNMHQWNGNYPSDEILLNDISNNNLYVCYSEDLIYAVFYHFLIPNSRAFKVAYSMCDFIRQQECPFL